MTGPGRWLVGILNAHIERHNVMPAETVTTELTIDTTRFDTALQRLTTPPANVIPRPCPICGCHAAMADHWCSWRAGVMPKPIALSNSDGSPT